MVKWLIIDNGITFINVDKIDYIRNVCENEFFMTQIHLPCEFFNIFRVKNQKKSQDLLKMIEKEMEEGYQDFLDVQSLIECVEDKFKDE